MTWLRTYENTYFYKEGSVFIEHDFYKSEIIIQATCSKVEPGWRRAAVIYPVFFVPGIGKTRSKSEIIYLDTQYLTFPPVKSPFNLEFVFQYKWITNLKLVFLEFVN